MNFDKTVKTYIGEELTKVEKYYSDGGKKNEYNYKNGKLEGKQYRYYWKHLLEHELNYKNNLLDGEQYYYDTRGKLSCVRRYIEGVIIN